MSSALLTTSNATLYNSYEGYSSQHAMTPKYIIPTQDILSMLPPPELIGPLGFDSLLLVPTAEEGARLLDEVCNHHPLTGNTSALDSQRDIEVTPIVAFAGEGMYDYKVLSEGAFNLSALSPPPPPPQVLVSSPVSSLDNRSSRSALPRPPVPRNAQASLAKPATAGSRERPPTTRRRDSALVTRTTPAEASRRGPANHGSIRKAFSNHRQPSDELAATPTLGSSSYARGIAIEGDACMKTSSGLLDRIAEEESRRIKRSKRNNPFHGSPGYESESNDSEQESDDEEEYHRTPIQGQTCLSTTIPNYMRYEYNNEAPALTRMASTAPTRVGCTSPTHEEHDATYEPMEGDLDEGRSYSVGPIRTARLDKGKRPLRRMGTGDTDYIASRSTSRSPQSADSMGSVATTSTGLTPTSSILSVSGNDNRPAHELTNEELRQLNPDEIAARMIPLQNAPHGLRWQCPWKVKGSQSVLCHQRCKSTGDMKRHLMTKGHQGSGVQCEHCLDTFTREDALRRHVRRTCKVLHPANKEGDGTSVRRTTRSAQRGRPY